MAKAASIEDSFASLEKLISDMENGGLSLDETFKKYNDGLKLIKQCNTQLDKVEKQIIVLNENGDKDDI